MEPGHQRIPFDDNRRPFLTALSYIDGETAVPIYADPATGQLLVSTSSGGLPTTPVFGQQTATGSAAALTTGALTNGVIVQALSTNSASVYVGGVGVTTGTGFELQAGQATSIAVDNVDDVYIVGNGQAVCWIGS